MVTPLQMLLSPKNINLLCFDVWIVGGRWRKLSVFSELLRWPLNGGVPQTISDATSTRMGNRMAVWH